MPVRSAGALDRASVSGTVHVSARFIRHGVVFLIGVRPHRMIGYINAVGIDIELSAGSTVLHIISPVVLGQPRAFDITSQNRVAVVLAETFPTVAGHVEAEKLFHLSFGKKAVILVQLHSSDGIDIGRSPEHIGPAVIVDKQVRVLQVMQDGGGGFPFSPLRVVGVKDTHRTGRIAGDVEHRVFVVMGGGGVASLRIPVFGSDKVPVQQILRMPVAIGAGDEHIVFATEPDHRRIGTGTVRDVLVGVIDHICIIYVQRIAVGILPHILCGSKSRGQEEE